jgi:LuxR family transcriptional regulator
VLEYLEKVIRADTIDAVWNMHVAKMAEFGFDRLIYGLSYEAGTDGLGALEDMMVLSNHSAAYLERFLGTGLYRDSPMLRWAQSNSGSCSWRRVQLVESALNPGERDVIALNRQMGITAGVTISFGVTPPCGRSVIGLTARHGLDQADVDTLWETDGRAIELMNHVAHLKIATLPRTHFARRLTPRQREVLQLVGAGKTAPEIAALMGVSQVTIEKHLRLARQELGAETSAQALLKAAVQSQIFVPRESKEEAT